MSAMAILLWSLMLVTVTGYVAVSRRGWPPSRLGRAAAATVTLTTVHAAAEVWHEHTSRPAALVPVRTWAGGWHHPAALTVAQAFAGLAPVAVPAGPGLAAGLWSWRNYAVSARIGGRMASAPVTLDTGSGNGRSTQPPAALLTRRYRISVGGTIRAIGCPW